MICSVEGCDRPVRTRGLCKAHALRLQRTGSASPDIPIRCYSRGGIGCATCGEADFARDYGGDAMELASALGLAPDSLRRHFKRHDRPDLAAWARSATNPEYRYYRL